MPGNPTEPGQHKAPRRNGSIVDWHPRAINGSQWGVGYQPRFWLLRKWQSPRHRGHKDHRLDVQISLKGILQTFRLWDSPENPEFFVAREKRSDEGGLLCPTTADLLHTHLLPRKQCPDQSWICQQCDLAHIWIDLEGVDQLQRYHGTIKI